MPFDDNYLPMMERTFEQRVEAAGFYLLGKIRENVSAAGRTITHVPIKSGKRKGQTRKVVGKMHSAPSAPGDSPARQTGRYRASLATGVGLVEDSEKAVRVGSPMMLSRWLELGTSKKVGGMLARPHLRRTLREEERAILLIITTGRSK